MGITNETTVRRRADALAATVGDEVVLMSVEFGKYYGLDPIASDVWLRIAEPVSVGDLCSALAEEYDADPATITADVVALLELLERQSLLDLASPTGR